MQPPNAPTAAASDGVERPKTIEPSTARISRASGKKDVSSILNTSSRSQFQSQYKAAIRAIATATAIQNHTGTGRRSALAAAFAPAVCFDCAFAAGALGFASLLSSAAV